MCGARAFSQGIELVEDKKSKTPMDEAKVASLVSEVAKQGVLVGRTNRSFEGMNNCIYLAPALVATSGDIDAILSAIRKALENFK